MYVAGKQTKKEEGPVSIYSASTRPLPQHSDQRLVFTGKDAPLGVNNSRLNSEAVRETVQGERKP